MDIVDNEEELLGLYMRNRKRSNLLLQAELADPSTSSKVLKSQGILLSALYLRYSHSKSAGFIEMMEKKSDLEFFNLCRVTRKTFNLLLEKLTSHEEFQVKENTGGKPPIGVDVSLMITLWYLARQGTYTFISEIAGISNSGTHSQIEKVINVINKVYKHVVEWPSVEKVSKVEKKFRMICNFPGVIAAIGDCNINIRAPDGFQKDFLDRSGNHSINLLAACDANKKFLCVCAGEPGSAHGQQVLSNSQLGMQLEKDYKSLCYSDDYHLIGNSTYALKNYMMVPYRDTGDLYSRKLTYNVKLGMTHGVIRNAFALLKSRFGRLEYIEADRQRVINVVSAACILHNIAMDFEEERKILLNNMEICPEETVLVIDNTVCDSKAGIKKRNEIMKSL